MLSRKYCIILAILLPGIIAIQFSKNDRVFLEQDHDIEQWKSAGWKLTHRVSNQERLRLAFAIKHQNLAKLEKIFWSVSDPKSKEYGRHLNIKAINNLVKPADESMKVVRSWLQEGGVDNKHCDETMNSDYIICETTSGIAEILLNGARFYRFHHEAMSKSVIRSIAHYSVPREVAKHLDFVSGSLRFPPLKPLNFASRNRANMEVHGEIYPAVLRARYNVSNTVGMHPNNNQAVAQFLEEYYSPDDLKEFFAIFGRGFMHHSDVTKVVGPNNGRPGTEASLDVQYIMSLGANIPTWFWSTAGRHESQEPFLEWIIAIGNMSEVPYVFSISYGDNEDSLSVDYMKRINVEFMKAGLRGITILFSSGDDGAGCHKTKFRPNFPASSPYVTAVGGTALNKLGSDGEYGYEISGGGFSNVFKRPNYQESAVSHYLQSSEKLPSDSLYNKAGRAYPDISAVCIDFWIVNNHIPFPGVMGTSASAPTVAGIISLVNDMRLQNNKPSMGFINPFLYSNMKALYDPTTGYNKACGDPKNPDRGFYASVGWDPVTGCGTPNYPAMVEAALKDGSDYPHDPRYHEN